MFSHDIERYSLNMTFYYIILSTQCFLQYVNSNTVLIKRLQYLLGQIKKNNFYNLTFAIVDTFTQDWLKILSSRDDNIRFLAKEQSENWSKLLLKLDQIWLVFLRGDI